MANPPPGLKSRKLRPSSFMNGYRYSKTLSIAFEYGSSSYIGDPRWKWTPLKSRFEDWRACFIAILLSPDSIENPNLTSNIPVVVCPCVCASIDGDKRNNIPWVIFFDLAISFNKFSSWKPSTIIVPTPRSIASDSSPGVLLFPWKSILEVGNPADWATATSPPDTTSSHRFSSLAICAIYLFRNALEA